MAVVVVLSSPNGRSAPDSTPRRIVSALPDVAIEVAQIERDGVVAIPYFWIRNVPAEEFESVAGRDPRIETVHTLEETGDGALCKAEWRVDSPLVECLARTKGAVMEARGTSERWRLTLWFDDGGDASAYRECCEARDVPLELISLRPLTDAVAGEGEVLTGRQRDALVVAYENGYFDEPRRASQVDVADELDIASSSAGSRLRRGVANLIEQYLDR